LHRAPYYDKLDQLPEYAAFAAMFGSPTQKWKCWPFVLFKATSWYQKHPCCKL